MPGFKELLIFGEFFMLKIFLFMNIGSYKIFAGAMVTVAPIYYNEALPITATRKCLHYFASVWSDMGAFKNKILLFKCASMHLPTKYV